MLKSKNQGFKKRKKTTRIEKGDYQLCVLIEATSSFSLNLQRLFDVKIGVKAFGQSQFTGVKSKIGIQQTIWGQYFYFQKYFDHYYEAQNEKIVITVYDYNKIMPNVLIGTYEIDIQYLYSQPSHTMQHTWLTLTNKHLRFSEITGYIKVSASFFGQNDQIVELAVQPLASINSQRKILMAPLIQKHTYLINVQIIKAKNIKLPQGKKINSYIGVEFGDVFEVTETVMDSNQPEYLSRIFIPVLFPLTIQNLAIRLQRYNILKKTQILGSYYIKVKEIVKSIESNKKKEQIYQSINFKQNLPIGQFQWVNFYGPQIQAQRQKQKNIQQFLPEMAPCYIGSVLMNITVEETSNLQLRSQKMFKNQIQSTIFRYPPLIFKIIGKFQAAVGLYFKNNKHRMLLRVGVDQIQTRLVKTKNGYCMWDQQLIMSFQNDAMQTIPDIFVYLLNQQGQRLCYCRFKPKPGIIVQNSWQNLKSDSAMIDIENQETGFVKMNLQLKIIQKFQQRSVTGIKQLSSSYYVKRKCILVIDLLCANSLIPLDEDGTLDAYFVFSFMNSQVTSSIKSQTLNPCYYERLIMQSHIFDEIQPPPIIVKAYDKDNFSSQFVGYTRITIEQAKLNGSFVDSSIFQRTPEPFWYQLHQNEQQTGSFLCMITMFSLGSQIPRQIQIKNKKFRITLVIMGLRGIKKSGIISIKQPFIQFDFKSLNLSNKSSKNKIVRTQPIEKGESININSIQSVDISLPQIPKYWPKLTAKVIDNVIGNIYQPTIGFFSIDLESCFRKTALIKQIIQSKSLYPVQQKEIKKNNIPPRLVGLNEKIIISLRQFFVKNLNSNWKIMNSTIDWNLNDLTIHPNKELNNDYIIIFPYYENQPFGLFEQKYLFSRSNLVEKYKQIIDKNGHYMEVGHDQFKKSNEFVVKRNKHYRYVLQQTYQSYYQRVKKTKIGLMDQIPIKTGSHFINKQMKKTLIGKITKQEMIVGTYKGQTLIHEIQQNNQLQQKKKKQFRLNSQLLLRKLMRITRYHLFLYILQGNNISKKDQFSHSDPYLIVKIGKQKFSFQKQYFQDEPNPKFAKKVQALLTFPEDSLLEIQVWDYDRLGSDQLIGSTSVDLENRIQANISTINYNNPIQTHNLYHFSSKRSQGLIKFWIDLVPQQNIPLYRDFDISLRKPANFQLRVIVWQIYCLPVVRINQLYNYYVQCTFGDKTQKTDIHDDCGDGIGRFNWRMKFDFQMPIKNPQLTFKIFDKELILKNQLLSSCSLNIQSYLKEAFEKNKSITLLLGNQDLYEDKAYYRKRFIKDKINGVTRYDRFKIPTIIKQQQITDINKNNLKQSGNIQVSIQILPEQQAKIIRAGRGRQAPNQNPYLPPPKGRESLRILENIANYARQFFSFYKYQIILATVIIILVFCIIFPFVFSLIGGVVGAKAMKQ